MPPTRRQPLGEATRRVNNSQDRPAPPRSKIPALIPHHESHRPGGVLQAQSHTTYSKRSPLFQVESQSTQNRADFNDFAGSQTTVRRPEAISRNFRPRDPKRYSDLSNSTDGSGGRKKDIGPWNLGKTLGEGATARVRKARHRWTGEMAAVKIVQKTNARMSQAGSLAALDHLEATLHEDDDSAHRMPFGIEREVAIMKLIDHPHVLKLQDIWENRTEIYLVLEFVDNGELFDYITSKDNIREAEAMKFWRQILSAVGYCHSFNICHRDLKPENILLTKDGNIKIADFGMAALTQTQEHRLDTSCGSPHYAAPEIISGARYAGNRVDIWSMGVILYALLSGKLPFDHPGPNLQPLLGLVMRGQYEMLSVFSSEAKDLIGRILRLSPSERPTIKQIWRHPLVRKYDYLDNLNITRKNHISLSVEERCRPLERPSDIDGDLLRHLRSMWHMFNEEELIRKLLSKERNEQRRFYALLLKYKESQREDYHPELEYSNSDYHHARPLNQVRKLSTCQFVQPAEDGHGEEIKCFTVVGNGSREPTVSSYDPFKASKLQNPDDVNSEYLNSDRRSSAGGLLRAPGKRAYQASSVSTSSSINGRSRPPARRGFTTRNSLASSTRSRGSASGVVKATVGHKRVVSFPHNNKRPSPSDIRPSFGNETPGNPSVPSEGADEGSELPSNVVGRRVSGRYIRSKKTAGALLQPILVKRKSTRKSGRASRLWEDDVRQVSTSLEKDCDQAFYPNELAANSQAMPSSHAIPSVLEFRSKITSTQLSSFREDDPRLISSPRLPRNLQVQSGKAWWDQRPLPRPPARSGSIDIELAEARRHAELRKALGNVDESPGFLDRKISHIDHLMHPSPSPPQPSVERRIRSAPGPTTRNASKVLPPIEESSADGMSARSGSDLESQAFRTAFDLDDRNTRGDARQLRTSIRIVPPSSPVSNPIKPTAPLKINKQSRNNGEPMLMTVALGAEPGQEYRSYEHNRRQAREKDLPRIDEYDDADEEFEANSNGTVRHKGAWFKRSSRSSADDNVSLAYDPPEMGKKKAFGLGTLFKKRGQRNDPEMAIALDSEDTMSFSRQSLAEDARHARLADAKRAKDLKAHQTEPHRNWLARLFKVTPVKRYICCDISRRRARQEIVNMFKEWKRHGLTDIVVDKQRNIVYARIQTPNSLQVKELSFAAEVMTVIEHGTQHPLSIVRITQEKGAASSLERVADNIKSTLQEQDMLVTDKRKAKMMIKTLNLGEQAAET